MLAALNPLSKNKFKKPKQNMWVSHYCRVICSSLKESDGKIETSQDTNYVLRESSGAKYHTRGSTVHFLNGFLKQFLRNIFDLSDLLGRLREIK